MASFLWLVLALVALIHSFTDALDLSCSNKPIVISGAGPAALIFAHRFLRLTDGASTRVVLFEKRNEPLRYIDSQDLIVAGDNAFGFGVSKKSQLVLNKTPGLLEAVERISQPTAFAPGIDLRIVNRRELCAELAYKLQQEYGDSSRLQLHYGMALSDVELDKKEVVVIDSATNTTQRVSYSLLIAADGANSIVRAKLIEKNLVECERYYSDTTWKALQLPQQPQLNASTFVRYPKPFYKPHRFIKKDNGAILPRYKDKFVLLNFRSIQSTSGSLSNCNPFDATTPQQLKERITRVLPNVTNFPTDDVLQDFLQQPPGRESWMKLNTHYIPTASVVLIGDASVGMYSLFGQGAASAMTQANVLAETIAPLINNDNMTQLQDALAEYSNWSVKEGHAISDLNLLTHVLRKKGLYKMYAGLQMMSIGKTLSTHPEVSYSDILAKKKRMIWFSKLFWKRIRMPAPTTTSTKTTASAKR